MKGKIMVKRLIAVGLWVLAYFLLTCSIAISAEKVKLTYWTHWGENAGWNAWYEEGAKKFSMIHPEVKLIVEKVDIPYEGYEAKYMSAFAGVKGAPDIFNGQAHIWAPKGFVDPMPANFARYLEDNLLPFLKKQGIWKGKRYGVPLDAGGFLMLHINVDMFRKAGLDPNKPIENYDEFLEDAKKLTKDTNGDGKIDQWGYGIRHKGHPLGIADKFITPFLHAWDAKMIDIEKRKASGYINSKNAVEALQFYGDLVNKYHVSSLDVENPVSAYGQRLVAMFYRESFFMGWLEINAPGIDTKIYPIPKAKVAPGPTTSFPWCDMVYKYAPEEHKKWAWKYLEFITSPLMDIEHSKAQPFFPPHLKCNMLTEYAKSLPHYYAMKEMMKRPPAPTYFIPESHELLYVLGSAIQDVLLQRATAEDALNAAAVKMDRILKGE